MNEFQTELVKTLGIEHLSQEEQEKVVVGIGENILRQVIVNVYDKVPETDRDEFHALIESGNVDDMRNFLEGKVDNVDDLIQGASKQVIEEFKTLVSGS